MFFSRRMLLQYLHMVLFYKTKVTDFTEVWRIFFQKYVSQKFTTKSLGIILAVLSLCAGSTSSFRNVRTMRSSLSSWKEFRWWSEEVAGGWREDEGEDLSADTLARDSSATVEKMPMLDKTVAREASELSGAVSCVPPSGKSSVDSIAKVWPTKKVLKQKWKSGSCE